MKKLSVTFLALIFVFVLGAQEKFSVPEVAVEKQHKNMVSQINSIVSVSIKYIEENNLTIKDYAGYVGNQFKTSWDKSKGYDGFVNGMIYNLVSFTHPEKVEIVKTTESSIILKSALIAEYLKKYPEYYTTHEKYTEFFFTIMTVIGEYMGCDCQQDIKDDHMLVTITKKE